MGNDRVPVLHRTHQRDQKYRCQFVAASSRNLVSREEMRHHLRDEERWKLLIDFLEGERVPNIIYKRVTLDQFTLWGGILHL